MIDVSQESQNVELARGCGPRTAVEDSLPVIVQIDAATTRNPDAPALRYGDVTLSYGAMDRASNALAAKLERAGVRRGDLLPLVFEGGVEVVLGALAAMKLGATFIPLDTTWPRERLRQMLQILAARVCITRAGHDVPVVDPKIEVVEATASEQPIEPAVARAVHSLDDVTYAFFTSGSTGFPKCALNVERGLVNRFNVMTRRFRLGPGDCVLQNSRHVFDSSLWQFLWPLTRGATVVVPERGLGGDFSETIELVARHRVVMTDFVPSVFNLIVERMRLDPASRASLQSFRYVLVGGEAINAKAVADFLTMVPGAKVVNTYGPTEAAIGMVFHEVASPEQAVDIPLGRPIDNTFVVVLDEHGQPVGPGKTGEAHIGGVCLGLGYLRDTEQTRRAFVPNRFEGLAGSTLYRTGDIVSWDEDWLLHFHGRTDEQIKLDGVRIELSEIERCLLAHPRAQEAKVLLLGDEPATRRLVACVVGSGVTASELRTHVEELLPASMRPSEIAVVESMPLNHNGKLDRAALRLVLEASRERSGPAVGSAPEGPVEWAIANMFCQLLGRSTVDRALSFLDAGGSSLQSMRLLFMIQERFGVDISIQTFALDPSPRALASIVASRSAVGDPIPLRVAWDDEARLPDDIVPAPRAPARPVERVLLTGATGFIGAHLLDALARRCHVTCVVRDSDAVSVTRRLQSKLRAYRLDVAPDRFVVVPGDVSRPGLGLGDREIGPFDAVVHAAGEVNFFFKEYAYHRSGNVLGTIEALRLAAHRGAAFHHLSTSARADGGPPVDGYTQSKWISNRLVQAARARGLRAHVYMIGEAMSDAELGHPNDRSLVHALLQSGVTLGVFPFTRAQVDYAPVNVLCEAIARGVCREDGPDSYDMTWPHRTTFANLSVALASAGVPMRFVSVERFVEALGEACRGRDVPRELLVAYSILREAMRRTDGDPIVSLFAASRDDEVEVSDHAYRDLGVATRPVDGPMVHAYGRELLRRAMNGHDRDRARGDRAPHPRETVAT